jgi:N-methylhydantoinase B
VANRAHHADVGGAWPGSLGLARDIHGEGLRIPPVRIVRGGAIDRDLLDLFCANVRNPRERREDLVAQVETLRLGARRLAEIEARVGGGAMIAAAAALRGAARGAAEAVVRALAPGVHRFEDSLDDGWPLRVAVEAREGRLRVDFAGTHAQVDAPLNANFAVTLSAVLYAFALLLPEGTPLNEGVREALDVLAPEGTLVNALYPAPVAGGNVETSQRIVDVVIGALDKALPLRLPAASQGTMNNLTLGWRGGTYYETIAGGSGGAPEGPGTSCVHTHLTNTRNTPIEALENAAPVVVRRLSIARGTGGKGRHAGGDGCMKEIEFTEPALVNLLTERRANAPYGLMGGGPGACGRNEILRGGEAAALPGRASVDVGPGDRLRIRTPGGGGYGSPV